MKLIHFDPNILRHFYFSKLLLLTLIFTAKSAPEGTVPTINTYSNRHNVHDFNAFKDSVKQNYNPSICFKWIQGFMHGAFRATLYSQVWHAAVPLKLCSWPR